MGKNLEKIWGESKSQGDESRWGLHYTRLVDITLNDEGNLVSNDSVGTGMLHYNLTILDVTAGHCSFKIIIE